MTPVAGGMRVSQRRRWSIRTYVAGTGVMALVVAAGVITAQKLLWPRPATALLLRRAAMAIDANDRPAAIRVLDEILEREPENRRALLYRGEMARDSGDELGALRFWSVVPDDPEDVGALARYFEGMVAYKAYRACDAEQLFLRAKRLQPMLLPPRERLVHLYQLQLRDAELRRELLALRKLRPLTLEELSRTVGTMGKIFPSPSRFDDLEKLIRADENDIRSTRALAEAYLAEYRFDDAVQLLDRSIIRDPEAQALRGLLAEALLKQNNVDRAGRVLAIQPLDDDAPVGLWRASGAYRAAIGEWNQAASDLNRAVQLDPDHIPTIYALGQALEHIGRHDEAERTHIRRRRLDQVALQAPRLRTNDPSATDFLFPIVVDVARLLLALERFAEALAWSEQALEWKPYDPEARSLSAAALDRVDRADSEAGTAFAETDAGHCKPVARPDRRPAASPDRHPTRRAYTPHAQAVPQIELSDRHKLAGIEYQYDNGASGSKYLLEGHGGGVAALDFDADGWPDLFFPQGCLLPVPAQRNDQPGDRLFQNLGGNFRDVTENSGLGDTRYSQGCAAGDFDNDGFADLAIANFGTNILYRNNGDGTFTDVTVASGIGGDHWSTSLAWADLDRDGNLDLYVVNYVLDPYRICGSPPDRLITCSPLAFKAEPDQLFRNRGDGAFEDVTVAAGIVADDGKGLGIVVADLDNDGWPDIYVANDGAPNFLFHNTTAEVGAPLRFVERGMSAGAAVSSNGLARAGMGIACGDLDGDGLLDLFVTNFYLESATLFKNQGHLLFVDASRAARLDEMTRPLLGFGTQPIDVDLDGRLDLFVANGHVGDFRYRGDPWQMRPQLLYNLGGESFSDASRQCGEYFSGEYLGRGVARVDWDHDGRPDIVVVHQDRPAALLRNESRKTGHRLVIDLRGVLSNRDAVGARIELSSGGTTQIHEVCGGDGFLATNERRIILGTGPAQTIERLQIQWPSGKIEQWTDLPTDVAVLIIEGRPPITNTIAE